jgi:hypothetical protein
MTTEDILTAVSESHPEMMAKTAKIIAITERLYPEFVPGIISDFETICSVVNEKTAEKMTGLKPYAIGIAGTVAGGLLSAIATDLYDAAKRGLTKGRNFKRIMEANPNLKREVDKKTLLMAYDTLHRYAPEFTADPLLGGALLKNISELPNMSHKTIVELIGAQKNIADAKSRYFSEMSKLSPLLVPDSGHTEVRYEGGVEKSRTVRRPGV